MIGHFLFFILRVGNSAVIIQGGKTGSGCCNNKVKVKTCMVPGSGGENVESFQQGCLYRYRTFQIKINSYITFFNSSYVV